LGAKTIFNLVTAVTQKELYRSKKKRFERWMKPLWSHSLGVAFASRWIALQGGMRQLSEESFMAGLLHDTGKLVILRAIEDHASDLPEDVPGTLIDQTLDQIHPALGEQLMRRMNLPDIYCRVAALHHHPDGGKDKDILSVVRLVNLACRKSGIGLKKDPEIELAASSEAAALELDGEVLDELQLKLVQYMDVLERL
jgi:HD-like signal output (HDOD) protein